MCSVLAPPPCKSYRVGNISSKAQGFQVDKPLCSIIRLAYLSRNPLCPPHSPTARGHFINEHSFHCNWDSMENSFCSHPSHSEVMVMKFCTWHDSCAVMPCAKFASDMIPAIELHWNQFSIEFELQWNNWWWNATGTHSTTVYELIIWNLIKKSLDLLWQIMVGSCYSFAHVTTAQLLWHVQNCDLIWPVDSWWQQN